MTHSILLPRAIEFDLDVTTTACLRPDVFEITCRSFYNRLFRQFRSTRLILNIDRMGEMTVSPEAMVEVARPYFDVVHWRSPEHPGFGSAAQWCWQEVTSQVFLHMEDDWLLARTVNADQALKAFCQQPDLAALRLYLRRNPGPDYMAGDCLSLNPGFIRRDFIRAALPHFNVTKDAEKQFGQDPLLTALSDWNYRLYGEPKERAYVVDIGKKWRKSKGLEKWNPLGDEVTWHRDTRLTDAVQAWNRLKHRVTAAWWSWRAGKSPTPQQKF